MKINVGKIFFTIPKLFFFFLLAITLCIVFIPLYPSMPGSALDLAWAYGANQIIAQGLVFGKDFIFTVGPYSAINTTLYHPATDHLMVFSSLYIAICYFVAVLYLGIAKPFAWVFVWGVFFAIYMGSRDALLFSYPLIVALVVYRMTLLDDSIRKSWVSKYTNYFIILLFSPLGLFPLIKGSLLMLVGAIISLTVLIFWINKQKLTAGLCILTPCVSTVIFWLISGQPIIALPTYFLNMLPVISGYSEAMAMTGNIKEIIVYLIAAAGILYMIGTAKEVPLTSKVFLFLSYAVFLFIAFKGGFVRHDGPHAIMAGISIIIAVILLSFSLQHRHYPIILLTAFIAWGWIDKSYMNTSSQSLFNNVKNNYVIAIEGLKMRYFNKHELHDKFTQALSIIEQEFPIPKMAGTTDIYSFNQAYLLASDNAWSPRPVLQSHGSYTEKLALLNNAHLLNQSAPDNIIFKVEPIDHRFPSLEDGVSWPTLINNYSPTKLDGDFLYLIKKAQYNTPPIKHVISDGTYTLNDEIILPSPKEFLFAEIDIRPTWIGRLRSLLYKPQSLEIFVELDNGTKKNYRFISIMGKSVFLLSPLVDNTKEFALLFAGPHHNLSDKRVKSIRISPIGRGASLYWKSTYRMQLSSFQLPVKKDLDALFYADHIQAHIDGVDEASSINCEGVVDSINGITPPPANIKISERLSVKGWLAMSVQEATVPDRIFVTLTDEQNNRSYIPARRTPRTDVKNHFQHPDMSDIGYEIDSEISELKGNYFLGLSRIYHGKLEHCQQFNIPLYLTGGQ